MENMKKEWVLMNKYEMGKVLGQGTFAKVYHARALSTGQSVAIKVIDKSRVLRTGMIDQIKREISVLRRVQHPNIVRLHEVMASKTKIYFVMEYVRGGELFDKVAMGRMKEDVARKYFQQLIGAVGFCHSRGVYHRDIKPENLLVGDDGELKVSDFGLSALWESRRQDGLLHTTCGTPAYVAPEVINKGGYDGAKVDIWSSGVVLFLLMAGYLPFHETNLMEMYRKISRGDFKCPYWFSTDAKKLLFRLLDPNPTTRISIAEIKENPWFKKGLQKPVEARKFYEHGEEPNNVVTLADIHKAFSVVTGGGSNGQNLTPTTTNRVSLNAFDIISLSPGFDLSRLFQEESSSKRLDERFMARKPVVLIN